MNTTDILPLPVDHSLEQFQKDAGDLAEIPKTHSESALLAHIQQHYPVFLKLEEYKIQTATFSFADAKYVIARSYGFESWEQFEKFIKEIIQEGSPVDQFESAIDAVITGDESSLKALLYKDPNLVKARSMRVHQATLLHYVSANGIEGYRQKTPDNAVAIAEILLKAGAETDAVLSDGQSTTLGLVATSIHPFLAGVQITLLETLLEAGAAVNGVAGGWQPLSAAIANGCPGAARFLALQGAESVKIGTTVLEQADWIKSFFTEDGNLKPNVTNAQAEAGFMWACEHGQNHVVEMLLEKVDLHSLKYTGLTGLHWAVAGGQLDTIRLLLERGASLEMKNIYGGTALNQALWWPLNGKPVKNYVPVIENLLHAGATIESGTLEWVEEQHELSPSTKTHLEKVLRQHGASS